MQFVFKSVIIRKIIFIRGLFFELTQEADSNRKNAPV